MVGGGVKSFRSEGSKQWGSLLLTHNPRSNGNAADTRFLVGGSNPGRPTVGGGAVGNRPGFGPPILKILVSRITIQPLLGMMSIVSQLLGAASATDKKSNPCVSV